MVRQMSEIKMFFLILLLIAVSIVAGYLYLFHSSTSVAQYEIPKNKKIIVYQCGAYRVWPRSTQLSMQINKLYCEKWGYEYEIIKHKPDSMPPYWLKVRDLNKLLPQADLVVYLDCDAHFNDFEKSIETIVHDIDTFTGRENAFYVGTDCVSFQANAGVFVVRNTVMGRQISSAWENTCITSEGELLGVCKKWKYDSVVEKWNCKNCRWAGEAYEQGQLAPILSIYPLDTISLPTSWFSSNPLIETRKNDINSYIIHLYMTTEEQRFNWMSQKLRSISSSPGTGTGNTTTSSTST